MASVLKRGNLSFQLQVGATGPDLDEQYGFYARSETWIGHKTDLAAFLAANPEGSAHPLWAYLKLARIRARDVEAGMVELTLDYAGHPDSTPIATHSRQFSLRSVSGIGKFVEDLYLTIQRSWGGSSLSFDRYDSPNLATRTKEYNVTVDGLCPTITFRYVRPYEVVAHEMATDAAALLESAPVSVNTRKSFVSETTTDYTYYFVGSSTTKYRNPRWEQLPSGGTDIIRDTLQSVQIGRSGCWQTDEVWVVALTAETA